MHARTHAHAHTHTHTHTPTKSTAIIMFIHPHTDHIRQLNTIRTPVGSNNNIPSTHNNNYPSAATCSLHTIKIDVKHVSMKHYSLLSNCFTFCSSLHLPSVDQDCRLLLESQYFFHWMGCSATYNTLQAQLCNQFNHSTSLLASLRYKH